DHMVRRQTAVILHEAVPHQHVHLPVEHENAETDAFHHEIAQRGSRDIHRLDNNASSAWWICRIESSAINITRCARKLWSSSEKFTSTSSATLHASTFGWNTSSSDIVRPSMPGAVNTGARPSCSKMDDTHAPVSRFAISKISSSSVVASYADLAYG